MQIIRVSGNLPPQMRGAAVALGNFDGVHRGHRALIEATRAIAEETRKPLAVASFEPHPRALLQPGIAPFLLTTLAEKKRRLEALGVDWLFVIPFDKELSELSAAGFAEKILAGGIGASHIAVGPNFRFGHKREGDLAQLEGLGARLGFKVSEVSAEMGPDGNMLSSTTARTYLADGRPEAAALVLGDPWEVEAEVVEGDRRGRQIGFPTANIELGPRQQPALGVYAIRVGIPNEDGPERKSGHDWHGGVANFGIRPTVAGKTPRLEAHLFDYSGDLYGKVVRVRLLHHIRPERKFADLAALKKQIAADAAMAREMLERSQA